MIIAVKVVVGLVLLFFGGELLVRGSVALAHRLGVSPLLIGLTIVACGTSAPELVVCLFAALEDAPGLAVGNVVGSNIANILLVLGAAGLVNPIVRHRRSLYRDGVVCIGATLLFLAFSYTGAIEAWHGAIMLTFLAIYLWLSYVSDRRSKAAAKEMEVEVREIERDGGPGWAATLRIVGGIAGVLVGSDVLVDGAVGVAREIGVSDAVIGITLVAAGTSLPELATAVVAAYHRHTDVALGNVLGSNIFNILAILGVVSIVTPVRVPAEIINFDAWAMLAVVVVFVPLAAMARHIGRPLALLFLMAYVAYVVAQFTGISGVPTAMS